MLKKSKKTKAKVFKPNFGIFYYRIVVKVLSCGLCQGIKSPTREKDAHITAQTH